MVLHKILRGDQAGLYLPFALSRLKALERISTTGFFQQRWVFGGYLIEVQQAPPFQYIKITEEGFYFEFFTSGYPVMLGVTEQPGYPAFATYKAAAVGVQVGSQGSALKTKAAIRTGARALHGQEISRIKRAKQVDLIDEPVSYPGPKAGSGYPRALYKAWAPNHPHTGLHFRAYNYQGTNAGYYTNRGSWATHAYRDIGFDTPFEDGQKLAPVRDAYLRGDADWPRANGLQKVTDPIFGSREFAIYIDAYGTFHAFPTAAIGPLHTDDPLAQNVDPINVKSARPAFPAWVYQPTQTLTSWWAANDTIGLVDFPEFCWEVHPDGTKACTVVYERAPVVFDSTYFAADQGSNPFDPTLFDAYRDNQTGVAARHDALFDISHLPQRYNSAPGALEVSVLITLTGSRLEDFSLAVSLTEMRRPTTSPYCTLLIGYCWHDIKAVDFTADNQHYDAKRGDLVTLDLERYYRPADGSTASFMSLKNLETARLGEIQVFDSRAVVDYDLKTLSFALLVEQGTTYLRTLNARSGAPGSPPPLAHPYNVSHPAINIFVLNRQKEMLFPDTIPFAQRTQLLARKTLARTSIMQTGVWQFMPLNDLRDWSDSELKNLRDYYATEVFQYKSVAHTTPAASTLNWWTSAMFVDLPTTGLFYVTDPRPGWYLYTDELLNRLHVTPFSTFFTHPNGTWAFYDQQYVYNPQGMFGPTTYDALTPFDATQLEHVIFDRVHFANGKATKDTSFMELYNDAVTAGTDAGTLTETFLPLTKAQLRATFEKQIYEHPDTLVQELQLKTTWYPNFIGYYPEPGYQGGAYNAGTYPNAGGLVDLSMGDIFYSEPAYGGTLMSGHASTNPITFSSCILIS